MNTHYSILRPLMCLCLCTLLVTLTLDLVSAQPVVKAETSASALHDKAKTELEPKIIAPKEQKDEVVKALAFLKGFEKAVMAKDYNQIARLISSDFVKVMPGQPFTKEDIKFIDSLLCGWVTPKVHSCTNLRNLQKISLLELSFYAADAWVLRYSITGRSSIGTYTETLTIDLSLTKETVEGEGKALRLMGPAG